VRLQARWRGTVPEVIVKLPRSSPQPLRGDETIVAFEERAA
jgi:hypothetical protein